MSLVIKGQFGLIVDAVREKRPVIHHLTNYVTAGDCANITLCAGASPVMADEAEEVVEITSNADALVLNLGTIAKAKMQAMETAAAAAKNKGIAVVLDPVGVMASKLRLVFALKLLNEGLVTIVRGNYAECLALLEEKAEGRGVDSNGNVTDGLRVAKDAAEKYNCAMEVDTPDGMISAEVRAETFLQWMEELKEKLGIPKYPDMIREEDVNQIVKWAQKEANPVYPVPEIWDAQEMKEFVLAMMEGARLEGAEKNE